MNASKRVNLCSNTPACWQPARVRGLCPACYSATRRLAERSVEQLATYLCRLVRMEHRVRLEDRSRRRKGRAA